MEALSEAYSNRPITVKFTSLKRRSEALGWLHNVKYFARYFNLSRLSIRVQNCGIIEVKIIVHHYGQLDYAIPATDSDSGRDNRSLYYSYFS